MPIDQVQLFFKQQRAEFVVYYTRQAGFKTFKDAFLAQLQNIPNRY